MKTKHRFLLTLLMATVMMTMCPALMGFGTAKAQSVGLLLTNDEGTECCYDLTSSAEPHSFRLDEKIAYAFGVKYEDKNENYHYYYVDIDRYHCSNMELKEEIQFGAIDTDVTGDYTFTVTWDEDYSNFRVSVAYPDASYKINKGKLNKALSNITTNFTLTFADSYAGSDEGTIVGSGIKLYDNGEGNYVVAPTVSNQTIYAPKDCDGLFSSLTTLTSVNFNNFNTENVKYMDYLFSGCSNLESITFGNNFNTKDVRDMCSMFSDCTSLQSLDLSGFDTSLVGSRDGLDEEDDAGNGSYMFSGCTSLESLTIGNFDMGGYRDCDTDYSGMFDGCEKLNTLTMKSLSYLVDGTFNTQFSGEGKTVKYEIDDNSALFVPYEDEFEGWVYSGYPEATVDPTYTRTIAAGSEWGTVVLPFRAAAENGDVQLYYLDEVTIGSEEGTMQLKKYENSVSQNTPCVFRKKNKNATTVTFTGAKDTDGKYVLEVGQDPTTDYSDGWRMHGTYSKRDNIVHKSHFDNYTPYFIAENKFWLAEKEITVDRFRAWFEGPVGSGSGAKALNIVIADDADGIKAVNSEQLTVNNGKFIENGKVVVVKNGKKFNLNGQRVR